MPLPLFSLLFVLMLLGPPWGQPQSPALVHEQGLWVESLDTIKAQEVRQTEDNSIYRKGYRFVYRYYFIDPAGHKYLQQISQKPKQHRDEAWFLVPEQNRNTFTNHQFSFTVEAGPAGTSGTAGAVQSQIKYQYHTPAGPLYYTSFTGLIENEKNIWLHPPRERLFKLLQLNPYPFIQAPYQVGHHWQWQLEIGPGWGSPRWKDWEGSITNNYHYRISGEKVIDTPLGKLKCLEITSSASSRIGTTGLTAYFHPTWGFVLLHYTNIDGSKFILELLRRENITPLTQPFLR